ncbi:protein-cysteine N-palmitoyltransferase HHAT-like [Liolophura sinensis]|uniref:protein-cysteine N-palmitoyltransferase HHAT-like n=1 Tax=Liolophura sinensis TaxID=3198878 RepID=UPI0031592EF4
MSSQTKVTMQPVTPTQPLTSMWKFELILYSLIWCGGLGYSCYSVFLISAEYKEDLNPHLFEQGWKFLDRDKDVGDFEWTFFYSWFWVVLPWYLGYCLVTQLLYAKYYQYRTVISLVISVLCLCWVMGWRPVALILSHCAVCHLTSCWGSPTLVWLTCLLLLSTLNFEPFFSLMKVAVPDDPMETKFYLLLFTLALCNLRYTSFCLEKVQRRQFQETRDHDGQLTRTTNQCTFIDLLAYTFYLPLFFHRPLLTYDVFSEQISEAKQPWTLSRVVAVGKHFTRVIFWAVVIEFTLHYFYFHSLQGSLSVMMKVPLWGLAGIGYLHGQFFMMKYVVMFGFPACVAKVDGLNPPEGPKCISRICYYSDMWKYFDRGLYSFIKRYIYVPLGGSRCGLVRQLTISALTFLYVFYWHGAELYLFLWAALNYLGIMLELLGAKLTKILGTRYLGSAMASRLHALCTVPLFAMSALSIFVFFGGAETGQVYFNRLLIEGYPVSVLLIALVLYCGVHVCAGISQWEQQKVKQKVKHKVW